MPSRVDTQIVMGVKPARSSAAFARPLRSQHLVPRELQDMFDNNDEGGLRAVLERPVCGLASYASKVSQHGIISCWMIASCPYLLYIHHLLLAVAGQHRQMSTLTFKYPSSCSLPCAECHRLAHVP